MIVTDASPVMAPLEGSNSVETLESNVNCDWSVPIRFEIVRLSKLPVPEAESERHLTVDEVCHALVRHALMSSIFVVGDEFADAKLKPVIAIEVPPLGT
jgi:hypothetical protein